MYFPIWNLKQLKQNNRIFNSENSAQLSSCFVGGDWWLRVNVAIDFGYSLALAKPNNRNHLQLLYDVFMLYLHDIQEEKERV